MYLKALNLKGFKSFPDRTRLTFPPGVSVIVGPNGCGKSNITDAVLWALGEQSPTAVRGQSMQDVIFAGGKGQSPRRFAEVEVVIDNSEGRAASEFSEISITRRIDRSGDGEYRLNGARCRLSDVVEVLSDTNMGREMHSVISQGRVEAIVNSKPRDRKLLIEEAAGLGKHRKRRHRAQLKLERTTENLERALDVEREARSRLRPLKRQAEAAERGERLQREEDELRAQLVAGELREREDLLAVTEETLAKARQRRDAADASLEKARERRQAIEERIAEGESARKAHGERVALARGTVERLRARAEAVAMAERELKAGLGERQLRLEELGGDPGGDGDAAERVAQLEAELAQLESPGDQGPPADLAAAAERAAARQRELEDELRPLEQALAEAEEATRRAVRAHEAARAEAEKASARTASLAGELAAVEARLASAGSEGGDTVLAGMLQTAPGLERALSAALGERARAALVGSVPEGTERLRLEGGVSRAIVAPGEGEAAGDPAPPVEGARRLLDLVQADEGAAGVARRLLVDTWLVEDLAELPDDFEGVAVTVKGESYESRSRELRRLPREGTDPAIEERSRREELVLRVRKREQTERRSARELELAEGKLRESRAAEDEARTRIRELRRRLDEATEETERSQWLARRRAEGESTEGPEAVRRAQLEAELAAERRHLDAGERERERRGRDREALERRIELERGTLPAMGRVRESLERLAAAAESRAEALDAGSEPGGSGEDVAAELRECSREEFGVQDELRGASEALTAAEVEASQLRDRRDESATALGRLSQSLERELTAAGEALGEEQRGEIELKLTRVARRREQIGPVNPLASSEYEEARERATELREQRQDTERAMSELEALIRRTDREMTVAFEQTFEATAKNFEEMAAELFPGGRGRLRRVDVGPRPVPEGGADGEGVEEGDGGEEAAEREQDDGVEIEVTPAGKATRRLTLLSGGEKSLVALAFVFAVLLARPCPFYILDEVEAALDDLNLDRFLRLVRRFAERSQFVIVTHQKRTMDAADVLYGVSMGDDGVTKVVSRRLPREVEGDGGDGEIRIERTATEAA